MEWINYLIHKEKSPRKDDLVNEDDYNKLEEQVPSKSDEVTRENTSEGQIPSKSTENTPEGQTEKFSFAHKRFFSPENFAQKCRTFSPIIMSLIRWSGFSSVDDPDTVNKFIIINLSS